MKTCCVNVHTCGDTSIHPPARPHRARLNIGFLLASDEKSSMKLSGIVWANAHIPDVLDLRHWICGVFLIFQIEKDGVRAWGGWSDVGGVEWVRGCIEG